MVYGEVDNCSYGSYNLTMLAVGVKNLKNNLSRYLEKVRAGEHVFVTDHDEIIAELHSPQVPLAAPLTHWQIFLLEQHKKGTVNPASRTASSVLITSHNLNPWPDDVDLEQVWQDSRADK